MRKSIYQRTNLCSTSAERKLSPNRCPVHTFAVAGEVVGVQLTPDERCNGHLHYQRDQMVCHPQMYQWLQALSLISKELDTAHQDQVYLNIIPRDGAPSFPKSFTPLSDHDYAVICRYEDIYYEGTVFHSKQDAQTATSTVLTKHSSMLSCMDLDEFFQSITDFPGTKHPVLSSWNMYMQLPKNKLPAVTYFHLEKHVMFVHGETKSVQDILLSPPITYVPPRKCSCSQRQLCFLCGQFDCDDDHSGISVKSPSAESEQKTSLVKSTTVPASNLTALSNGESTAQTKSPISDEWTISSLQDVSWSALEHPEYALEKMKVTKSHHSDVSYKSASVQLHPKPVCSVLEGRKVEVPSLQEPHGQNVCSAQVATKESLLVNSDHSGSHATKVPNDHTVSGANCPLAQLQEMVLSQTVKSATLRPKEVGGTGKGAEHPQTTPQKDHEPSVIVSGKTIHHKDSGQVEKEETVTTVTQDAEKLLQERVNAEIPNDVTNIPVKKPVNKRRNTGQRGRRGGANVGRRSYNSRKKQEEVPISVVATCASNQITLSQPSQTTPSHTQVAGACSSNKHEVSRSGKGHILPTLVIQKGNLPASSSVHSNVMDSSCTTAMNDATVVNGLNTHNVQLVPGTLTTVHKDHTLAGSATHQSIMVPIVHHKFSNTNQHAVQLEVPMHHTQVQPAISNNGIVISDTTPLNRLQQGFTSMQVPLLQDNLHPHQQNQCAEEKQTQNQHLQGQPQVEMQQHQQVMGYPTVSFGNSTISDHQKQGSQPGTYYATMPGDYPVNSNVSHSHRHQHVSKVNAEFTNLLYSSDIAGMTLSAAGPSCNLEQNISAATNGYSFPSQQLQSGQQHLPCNAVYQGLHSNVFNTLGPHMGSQNEGSVIQYDRNLSQQQQQQHEQPLQHQLQLQNHQQPEEQLPVHQQQPAMYNPKLDLLNGSICQSLPNSAALCEMNYNNSIIQCTKDAAMSSMRSSASPSDITTSGVQSRRPLVLSHMQGSQQHESVITATATMCGKDPSPYDSIQSIADTVIRAEYMNNSDTIPGTNSSSTANAGSKTNRTQGHLKSSDFKTYKLQGRTKGNAVIADANLQNATVTTYPIVQLADDPTTLLLYNNGGHVNEGIVSTASKLSTDGHMTWKVGEQLPSVSLAEPGPTGSAANAASQLNLSNRPSYLAIQGIQKQENEVMYSTISERDSQTITGLPSMFTCSDADKVKPELGIVPVGNNTMMSKSAVQETVLGTSTSSAVSKRTEQPLIPNKFNACKQMIGGTPVDNNDGSKVVNTSEVWGETKIFSPSVCLTRMDSQKAGTVTSRGSLDKTYTVDDGHNMKVASIPAVGKRPINQVSSVTDDSKHSSDVTISVENLHKDAFSIQQDAVSDKVHVTDNTTESKTECENSSEERKEHTKMSSRKKGKVKEVATDSVKKAKAITRRTGTRSSERLKSVAQKCQSTLGHGGGDETVSSHESVKKEPIKRQNTNNIDVGAAAKKVAKLPSAAHESGSLVTQHGDSCDPSNTTTKTGHRSQMHKDCAKVKTADINGENKSAHCSKSENVMHANTAESEDGLSTRSRRQSNSTTHEKKPSTACRTISALKGSDGKDDHMASSPTVPSCSIKSSLKLDSHSIDYDSFLRKGSKWRSSKRKYKKEVIDKKQSPYLGHANMAELMFMCLIHMEEEFNLKMNLANMKQEMFSLNSNRLVPEAKIMEKCFHVMIRDYMASYLQDEGVLGYLSHRQQEGFITLSLNDIVEQIPTDIVNYNYKDDTMALARSHKDRRDGENQGMNQRSESGLLYKKSSPCHQMSEGSDLESLDSPVSSLHSHDSSKGNDVDGVSSTDSASLKLVLSSSDEDRGKEPTDMVTAVGTHGLTKGTSVAEKVSLLSRSGDDRNVTDDEDDHGDGDDEDDEGEDDDELDVENISDDDHKDDNDDDDADDRPSGNRNGPKSDSSDSDNDRNMFGDPDDYDMPYSPRCDDSFCSNGDSSLAFENSHRIPTSLRLCEHDSLDSGMEDEEAVSERLRQSVKHYNKGHAVQTSKNSVSRNNSRFLTSTPKTLQTQRVQKLDKCMGSRQQVKGSSSRMKQLHLRSHADDNEIDLTVDSGFASSVHGSTVDLTREELCTGSDGDCAEVLVSPILSDLRKEFSGFSQSPYFSKNIQCSRRNAVTASSKSCSTKTTKGQSPVKGKVMCTVKRNVQGKEAKSKKVVQDNVTVASGRVPLQSDMRKRTTSRVRCRKMQVHMKESSDSGIGHSSSGDQSEVGEVLNAALDLSQESEDAHARLEETYGISAQQQSAIGATKGKRDIWTDSEILHYLNIYAEHGYKNKSGGTKWMDMSRYLSRVGVQKSNDQCRHQERILNNRLERLLKTGSDGDISEVDLRILSVMTVNDHVWAKFTGESSGQLHEYRLRVKKTHDNVTVVKKNVLPRLSKKRVVNECEDSSSSEDGSDDRNATKSTMTSAVSGVATKRSRKIEFITDNESADSDDEKDTGNRNAPKCTRKKPRGTGPEMVKVFKGHSKKSLKIGEMIENHLGNIAQTYMKSKQQ